MSATLERQIYEAIRGKCISGAAAERAAALAAELAVGKFTSTNSAMVEIAAELETAARDYSRDEKALRRLMVGYAQQLRQ